MASILIVEDNLDTAKMLEKRVNGWGYRAFVAHDPESAIALLERRRFEMVLLDLMLPAGGGELVLSTIRTSSRMSAMPVIVVSAVTDEECMRTIERMGISAYVQKPYDSEKLLALIKEVLDKRGGEV